MIDAAALQDAKSRFNLLQEVPGLALVAQTEGGEYHGPCPGCGGRDRFVAWPRHKAGPRAWCRQCHPEVMDPVAFLQWRDGLTFAEAAARLGVAATDPRSRPVAYYDYHAADGTLLFQVVRYEPKSFRQRRPRLPGAFAPRNDVDTDWLWNLQDTPRVLYRLPQVLAADPKETIWICEGEKDADALTACGLVATTNPHGAGKWRPEYSAVLAGRTVVVLPDSDAPGQAHGAGVAAACTGVARSVRVVDLPGSKDVSEWLAAGGTAEGLIELARGTPKYAATPEPETPIAAPYQLLTAADLAALPPPNWLIEGLFETGKLAGVFGFYGGGKSFMALDWALCVATGRPWQGHATQAGPVVYISPEGVSGLGKRLAAWQQAAGDVAIPDTFRVLPETVNMLDPETPGKLLATLTAYGLTPATLIVIDTLARSMPGGEENNQFFSLVVDHAAQVQRATGAAVLVVHHSGKNEAAGWRGGTGFPAGADTIIGFKNDDGVITLTCEKQKDHEYFAPSRWVLVPVTVGQDAHGEPVTSCVIGPAAWDAAADGQLPEKARQLLEALCEPAFEHGASLREMRDATGMENQPIFRAVNTLKKRDLIAETGQARTTSHRYKATRAGYETVGVVPPWQRVASRVLGSDTEFAPTDAGSITDPPALSAAGSTPSDTPPGVDYARSDTEYHGVSRTFNDQHPVPDGIINSDNNLKVVTVDDPGSVPEYAATTPPPLPSRNPWGLPPPGSVAPPDNPCPACHDWHWAWLRSGGWATLCQMPRGTPPPPGDEARPQ